MRKTAVVLLHLLSGNEIYCRVIVGKVVRHSHDFFLDSRKVRAFLGNDKALARMLFACRKRRIGSGTDFIQSFRYRNRILTSVRDALDPANRVRVSLADTLSPEGVGLAAGEHCIGINSAQGEHTGIPAA